MKRRNLILALVFAIAVTAVLLALRFQRLQSGTFTDSQQDSGLVRMQQVMDRARRGEKIVIGGIGGSITEGYNASIASKCYLSQVFDWWESHFPGQVKLINAGIGATGSGFGVQRVEDDLLSKNPDFVIVEFAVNDLGAPQHQETLEGLIRKTLNQPNQPAVLLLYFMMKDGTSTQADFAPLAEHYRLPQISYGDRIQQLVAEDRITLEDIFADDVHPNDMGHTYAANFVTEYLDTVYDNLPPNDSGIPTPAALPAPLYSAVFEHTHCLSHENFQPTMQGNWKRGHFDKACGDGWVGYDAGSELIFPDLEGTTFGIGVRVQRNRNFGIAEAWVDDGAHLKIDSYLPSSAGAWGGPAPTFYLIAENLPAGIHTLHIRILEEKNPEVTSTPKHTFELMNVFVNGVPVSP